ncbi:hypothetical protein BBJ28_00004395 [Nothophytophthora sp. Chile5]|nr:hypothetical protein BBJ28_00004395 [Nothophytophthora sp. Chile5]
MSMEDPPSTLALEQALAFADACELGSDEEMGADEELNALLLDAQTRDLFATDADAMDVTALPPSPQLSNCEHSAGWDLPPLAGNHSSEDCAAGLDTSLENALAVLSTCDLESIDVSVGVASGGVKEKVEAKAKTKKVKRSRASSPARPESDATVADKTCTARSDKSSPKEKNADLNQSDAPVKPPTKKRVRRQREELLYLRVKVKEMESNLSKLKDNRDDKAGDSSSALQVSHGKATGSSPLLASVWENLANRQYRDRERAERENRKLKSTLEGQIKLAKCLEKILEDQPEVDMLSGPILSKQSKLLTIGGESEQEDVYTQLWAEIEAGFVDFEATYDSSFYAEMEKEQFDATVTSTLEKGIAVQFLGFKRVPFPQEVAANGMWRFTSCEVTKRSAYFYEEVSAERTGLLNCRAYGLKIQSDHASLDYRCENIMECRTVGERVVIMSRGLAKPIKFSAAPVNGIRFHEVGWIVIEKAAAKDPSSHNQYSTLTSWCELRPIFEDDASDVDVTVGAVTDFVIDSFYRNVHLGEEIIANIMMEEAKKLAAHDDPLQLSVDDVIGLIDWKELDVTIASSDTGVRAPIPVVSTPPRSPSKAVPPRVNTDAGKPPKRSNRKGQKKKQVAPVPPPVVPTKPAAKKRVRREVVELKSLREKVKELEEQLGQLQPGFAPSAGNAGGSVSLGGIMPSVWISMAGRQLKDRTRAESENQELRKMLQDQLKIAQGLEDTLKHLPANQNASDQNQSLLPLELFGPSSIDTIGENLARLEQIYASADETLEIEGVNDLVPSNHEVKAILHPVYGMVVRFTTSFVMPVRYNMVTRVMWRFMVRDGLHALATSMEVRCRQEMLASSITQFSRLVLRILQRIYSSKDVEAQCFAIKVEEVQPARDFWVNQVLRKYEDDTRTILVGRSILHPYVKDPSHPTGISFTDDARLVISDCSSGGVPATCVKACAYLVPDFGGSTSDGDIGIGELTDFCVKIAGPTIIRCREKIQDMVLEEDWVTDAELMEEETTSALTLQQAFEFIAGCDDDVFSDAAVIDSPISAVHEPEPQNLKIKKKRIRKQKVELDYLRNLVVELEDKLKLLQRRACRHVGVDSGKLDSPVRTLARSPPSMSSGSGSGSGSQSVWEGIAGRQVNEEMRVLQENQRLKRMLESQIGLISSLGKLVRKRPRDETIDVLLGVKHDKEDWSLTSESEASVFQDQLAFVARAHLDAERVFKGPAHPKASYPFHEMFVKNGDTAIDFEMKSSSVVPFDLPIAGNAIWRMLAIEGVTQNAYFCRITDELVARTFGLHVHVENFKADFRGKHTFRRYTEKNRIVIVWKARVNPVEIGNTNFRGVQCHETGWVQLQRAGRIGQNDTPSTLVQMCSRMSPQFEDGVLDQEAQIQSLTELVLKFQDMMAGLCCNLVRELLVEEDWKSNGAMQTVAA